MKWKNLHTPNTIELDEATASDRYGKFTIEPLERGFGLTIGNSLRLHPDTRLTGDEDRIRNAPHTRNPILIYTGLRVRLWRSRL